MDTQMITRNWVPPEEHAKLPRGWALAVVDGSRRQDGQLVVGGAIFDRGGRLVRCFSRPSGTGGTSTEAEYRAIRTAVKLGKRMGFKGIRILTDAKSVAEAINAESAPQFRRPELCRIYQSVTSMIRSAAAVFDVRWVRRGNVTPAHRLANAAAHGRLVL